MNKYLVEIGVEEFPARFVTSTKEQLKNNTEKLLADKGLAAETYRLESTPRRFAMWLEDIQALDQATEEIVRGPAKKIAYDEEGRPSKALQGFMKSKGLTEEDIYFETQGKDEYVFAKVKKGEISVTDALTEIIPEAIRQISNPRSMRWGGKNLQFLRPIRWLVSLYNDEVLDFDLEDIPVSNVTKGHRFLGESEIVIPTIDSYEEVLEENFVIVDEKKRRDMINRGLNRLARENGGVPMVDKDLMDEVVHIIEYPTVFLGKIPEEYLDLPQEVIITPMKDHQRYFPVVKPNEKTLLPYFLSVRSGDDKGIENVVQGNERVLVPRLEDAKFFYDQDLSKTLDEHAEKLEGLTYHEELGTMKDKTDRLVSLSQQIGRRISCGADTIEHLGRAAELSKADLVTNMVIEFTELEGTMGRIYARKAGENPIVAQAIEEQYMPRSSGAELPQSSAGTILSLADKIDTLAGLFAIDVSVTGSQDPFGLRRAAIAVIDLLRANKINVNLDEIFRDALVLYVEQQGLVFDYDEVIQKIRDFFLGRLKVRLREEGVRYDVVDAVLATEGSDIFAFARKAKAVQKYLDTEDGNDLITSFVRIESMAEKATSTEVDEDALLEEDTEMYDSLYRSKQIANDIELDHYKDALEGLADWMPIINQYMDKTMILVDDEKVKNNRLAMLNSAYACIETLLIPKYIVRD